MKNKTEQFSNFQVDRSRFWSVAPSMNNSDGRLGPTIPCVLKSCILRVLVQLQFSNICSVTNNVFGNDNYILTFLSILDDIFIEILSFILFHF